tara:strand:- start:128 stop:679 length:552 start_codon:yes stop_codon:yes gene_type:complete
LERRVIDILADKHQDWINMAKSFKLSDDDANEIVQQMYLRITDYVDDPEKILYNEEEVNTFYVYVTMRNLYLSNHHKIKSRFICWENIKFAELDHLIDTSGKIKDQKIEFDSLIDRIESEVDKWYWYDKKVFNIHFNDGMSMRKIAKETRISLSSIFNTLSNSKAKIRNKTEKHYEKYKKSKS